jgi:glyoxylase-like metal-dependent hydrolase (beta-lactamase superfamily II)
MPPLTAPASGATVRMYRHGFGDCFLLALPSGAAGEAAYVLFDCGLFFNYKPVDGSGPGQAERLRRVALDVEEATGGRVDALVLTHEHFDHLAGFHWATSFEVLRRLEYRELWLAWTEDPDDELAQGLRAEVGLGIDAVRRLAARFGLGADSSVGALLGFSESTAAALARARELVPAARTRFLSPGDLLRPFGSDGARVYALGPPRHRPLLRSNFRESEVYLRQRGSELALLAALEAHAEGRADDRTPFGRDVGLDERAAREHPFFAESYGFEARHEAAWRRIDPRWLESLEALALQYDDYVNNTSLVLAIELPRSRRVLLFPGDAQVGNWLSWAEPPSEDDEEDEEAAPAVEFVDGDATVTGRELIERTVFYKVGHHGSHNATLRDKGLERMRAEDLVAFVPTDETWAWVKQGKGWKMPYLPIYRALLERTRGRVVQADCGLPDCKERIDDTKRADGSVPYSEAEWLELRERIDVHRSSIEAMRARLVEDELYFQWTVEDA